MILIRCYYLVSKNMLTNGKKKQKIKKKNPTKFLFIWVSLYWFPSEWWSSSFRYRVFCRAWARLRWDDGSNWWTRLNHNVGFGVLGKAFWSCMVPATIGQTGKFGFTHKLKLDLRVSKTEWVFLNWIEFYFIHWNS